ncbi:MAG: EamA family transporter RarD [Campylobacteraceae bacterium]|nr:EamA family transporter RarD [Campylobacteraceae bacterium]
MIYAICAFIFWGLIPIYFKQVSSVGAFEVLIHRIIWSVVVLILLILITKQIDIVKDLFKSLKKLKYLILSSFLVSTNWLIFIWAVSNDKIVETSLGYFINPLVNVVLGYIFFSERMNRNQYIAIFIATLAVLYQIVSLGEVPIISLALAFSFGLYGLVRKKIAIASIPGLFVETIVILPFALAYFYYLVDTNSSFFMADDSYITIMLSLGGIITVIPLLLFNGAATRMKLTTLGFFQYIGPTIAFCVAIFIYNEPMNSDKMVTFILIWIALVIFSWDGIKNKKLAKKKA